MLLCMRTTIDIPDQLFRQAKKAAADQGVALREIVLRALQAHLAPARAAVGYSFDWKAVDGEWNTALPVDNSAALQEFLEPVEDYLDRLRRDPE